MRLLLALAAAAALARAQEMPVPPRDSLAIAAARPDAPPTLSFLNVRQSGGVPGVALGGDGKHAPRVAGDVGTGGKLRGRAARRWLDGVLDMPTFEVSERGRGGREGRAALSPASHRRILKFRPLPSPPPPPQVAEFDPTADPDGNPIDPDAHEREEEEEAEAEEAAKPSAADDDDSSDVDPSPHRHRHLPPGVHAFATAKQEPVAGLEVVVGGAASSPRLPADPASAHGHGGRAGPAGHAKLRPNAAAPAVEAPAGAPPPGMLADVLGLNCSDNAAVNGKLTEPPDLALCAGGDFLVQAVNSAWAVFDVWSGDLVAGPFSLYDLFRVPKNATMTDPGCVFDPDATDTAAAGARDAARKPAPGRFFVTVATYSRRAGTSRQAVVVSKTRDPRDGFRGVYYVDTAATDPALGLPACAAGGCLGDYPTYGQCAHALWIGVNHYTFSTSRLQGAALYGVRKADLLNEGGPAFPRVAAYTAWGDAATRLGFTLQPATPALGTPPDARRGGTQYVLASSYFFRTNLSSIVAWAVTNTSLIAAGLPGGAAPTLTHAAVLPTLPLRKPARSFRGGLKQEGTDQRLDEKDERLQQVTLVLADTGGGGGGDNDGAASAPSPAAASTPTYHLWTNMQTAVSVAGAGWASGIAYLRVDPAWKEGAAGDGGGSGGDTTTTTATTTTWHPTVGRNGYVASPGRHALNGAIAASSRGAAMALSVVGGGLNYSAAFVRLSPGRSPGPILVPRPSPEPLHGFVPAMRNGDFTGGVAAPDGSLWLGAQRASGVVHTTAAGKKQNWGTELVRVDPGEMA